MYDGAQIVQVRGGKQTGMRAGMPDGSGAAPQAMRTGRSRAPSPLFAAILHMQGKRGGVVRIPS